jgi:hypothetical protein
MVASGMGPHCAVLDLTGVQGLTDELTAQLWAVMPNLERLSLKNCRRVTGKTLHTLANGPMASKLQCLDIGGCANVTTKDVLEVVPSLPALTELHASGLQWSDQYVRSLVELRDTWKALSFGFSLYLTQNSLRESLMLCADTLQSLALHFCDNAVDNALLGILGRNLPNIRFLDLRGNPNLNTVTGWYDGRASADLPAQPLTVLGRYTSLTEAGVEETRRVHPLTAVDLTVILDGSGVGAGIDVESEES